MSLSSIYKKIVLLSPRVEVLLRQFYWSNSKLLKRFKPTNRKISKIKESEKIDFNKVIEYLKQNGVNKGSLIIVHSSYENLIPTGLNPVQIISKLEDIVGSEGTIAMPVIRRYKEKDQKDSKEIVYDVKRTPIISGMLPQFLKRRNDCFISRFPLNPLAAIGKLASKMMEENLKGENPSPHGENSSWKFCLDNNAIIIGLGIDLNHHLTMAHVAEEAFPNWPIKDWFEKKKFLIKDGDYQEIKMISERKSEWGKLYLAERNYGRDLIKNKIYKTKNINSLEVSVVESKKLVTFLNERKYKAYPYIIPKGNFN